MKKINNSILLPIILACILFISIYAVVYFKKNRDLIDKTNTTVIENNKIIHNIDSLTTLKIKSDSIKLSNTNDSIIENQNKIIKLLETKKPEATIIKKNNIFTKIKNIF